MVCGIEDKGSRHKKSGRGGGVSRDYRWAASLDLKQTTDLAATIYWCKLFLSSMVWGKNAGCVYHVLQEGVL